MNQRPVGWALAPVNMLHDTDGLFADGNWIESKDQDINGTNRLIQLADIGDGYFIDKSARFVNDEKFTTLNCTEIKSGDVLIARMPDPLGRACIFPKIEQRCLTVVDIAIFRPGSNGVQNTWFMYWVNSPAIRSLINLNASGTTRKRISRGNLSAMELPVPPLPEQKRIADKLDATLARVDACRERLARVAPILKRFRQSVLAAAVSGRLTADWRKLLNVEEPVNKLLKEILKVSSGDFLPAKDMAKDGRTPVFGGNGINGFHNAANVSEETIVIGRVGYYCGSVHLTPAEAWVTDNALIVYFDETKFDKKFLFYLLQGINLRQNDSSTAQPVISGTKIYSIETLAPCLLEQHEIVCRVESLFAFADRLETRLAAAQTAAEQLTPALLAKAFRGELVPQDPADEPASELLQRLAASRACTAKPKRSRTPRQPA